MLDKLTKLVGILEASHIRYCLIGGLAMIIYNARAATIDMDFYILTPGFDDLDKIFSKNLVQIKKLGEDQYKMSFEGIKVDFLRADPIMAKTIFDRAKSLKLLNQYVQVASPEDLIVLKTIADRPVDRRDIAELKEVFSGQLDEAYIKDLLAQLRA